MCYDRLLAELIHVNPDPFPPRFPGYVTWPDVLPYVHCVGPTSACFPGMNPEVVFMSAVKQSFADPSHNPFPTTCVMCDAPFV
jgi:hypothetical protein